MSGASEVREFSHEERQKNMSFGELSQSHTGKALLH